MIQRIQTIYLAIAIICIGLALIFPFGTYDGIEFNVFGVNKISVINSYPLIYNVIASIILSLLAIFTFKNRKRQQLYNKVNFVILLILLVGIFIGFNNLKSSLDIAKENISYGIGMFLPIVALVAIIMAYRAIKKDEDLIKSMDRIR